jgi:serine/threonine protein phosphatase PrpC
MKLKSYAAKTHQGPYLEINEDGYEFDFENELFMILDGFGGSGIGDVSVQKVKQEIKSFYTQIADDPNATMPIYFNPRNLLEGNAILNSILSSHFNLFKENSSKTINQRAGVSLICAAKAGSILILIGIGNCVAYRFRKGHLEKIIEEETIRLFSQDDFSLKFRTSPLNALGMYSEMNYQLKEIRLAPKDKIILLSDGVYGNISEDEILYTMNSQFPDDHERINSLLNLSNNRGNLDNQTALILEF